MAARNAVTIKNKGDTYLSVFEEFTPDLVIDKGFVKRAQRLVRGFIFKREAHVVFFGGVLTGTVPVRYVDSDRDDFFDDLVGADEDELARRIKKLPSISPTWKRARDPFNSACLFLIYKIRNSKLSKRDQEESIVSILMLMQFKLLGSLLHNNYPNPVNKDLAELTYARLSNKFLLKQCGSWQGLLLYRAKQYYRKTLKSNSVFNTMKPDQAVIDMISAIHNGLKSKIKFLNTVMYQAIEDNEKITTESAMVSIDGETFIRDRVSHIEGYRRKLEGFMQSKHDFIRQDRAELALKIVNTAKERYFMELLEYIPENYPKLRGKYLDDLVDTLVVHAHWYMTTQIDDTRNSDVANIILSLRGVYSSPRNTDTNVIKLRGICENLAMKATRTSNQSQLASLRTALLVYLLMMMIANADSIVKQ